MKLGDFYLSLCPEPAEGREVRGESLLVFQPPLIFALAQSLPSQCRGVNP
jgi:hypothetical protein